MKQSEFSTPGVRRTCTKLKFRQTEAQVRSKLCGQRHANVKGFGYEKISDKKFCNGVTSPQAPVKFKTAFTLAEVLLTLAVIGIVAAITLPSLLVDTTEKAFDAKKRALHARLSQAIGMMSTLSGYGQYQAESKEGAGDGKDDAAETFLYEGLSKVYKMNNICDSDNLDKCGIPSSITTMAGESIDFPKNLTELNPKLIFEGDKDEDGKITTPVLDLSTTNTKAAAFETVNGESVAVFYNPHCKSNQEGLYREKYKDMHLYTQNRMCVNFVYDLNGTKGPNKVGRDIGFITALYAKSSEVVAPMPFDSDIDRKAHTQQESIELCANYSDDSRLPNKEEASSLFYNAKLVGNLSDSANYWTSSVVSPALAWCQGFSNGGRVHNNRSIGHFVRCIKK